MLNKGNGRHLLNRLVELVRMDIDKPEELIAFFTLIFTSKVSQASRPGIHGGEGWALVDESGIAEENLTYTNKSVEPEGLCPRMLGELADTSARPLSIIFERPWIPLPTGEMLHLYSKSTQRTAQKTACCPVSLQSMEKRWTKFSCMVFPVTWRRSRQLGIISLVSPRLNHSWWICLIAFFFGKRMRSTDERGCNIPLV